MSLLFVTWLLLVHRHIESQLGGNPSPHRAQTMLLPSYSHHLAFFSDDQVVVQLPSSPLSRTTPAISQHNKALPHDQITFICECHQHCSIFKRLYCHSNTSPWSSSPHWLAHKIITTCSTPLTHPFAHALWCDVMWRCWNSWISIVTVFVFNKYIGMCIFLIKLVRQSFDF